MRKTVYLVVKVQVEAGSWRKDKSAQEVAEECDYDVRMPTSSGYKVVGTEIVAASDDMPIQNAID